MLRQEIGSARPSDPPVSSDLEVLMATLVAVKKTRGLIHGEFKVGDGVCALGALTEECIRQEKSITIKKEIGIEIQEANDSHPTLSPAQRRYRMIQWLVKRIQELGAHAEIGEDET